MVNTNTIDARMIAKMFLAGAKNLEAKKEWINELNVFPVPDGDTGTNMTLTILSAASEVRQLEKMNMENLAKAISSGSLRGARGNSGVILSQLLRGFTKGISKYRKLNAPIIARALEKGTETAYKAVMKPKEGTILTVAKGAAAKAMEISENTTDLQEFFLEVLSHAEYVLSQTPEMLPVLKEAGVVDSGGQGLLEILNGAYDAYLGKEVEGTLDIPVRGGRGSSLPQADVDIKFGYCTEFMISLDKSFSNMEESELKSYLSSIGESLVVVSDDEIVKVHVHTNDPGLAIQKGLTFGSLSNMKIDNMREEHQEKLFKEAQKQEQTKTQEVSPKENGFISVSVGKGIGNIFKELGTDYLIEGGQTMNPSTEDMLTAISSVNAKNIYILPNNKNIILAANQAKDLTKDKNVIVIPTKSVPQGIAAMISFVPDKSVQDNTAAMSEEIKHVKTGQVTYAVRDTRIDDKEISQGDIMGIGDSAILAVGKDIHDTTQELISKMVDDESEIISVYYGEDTTKEAAEQLENELKKEYPDCDIEFHNGGQPIYYYLISVE